MGRIINPADPAPTLRQWLEAFTCVMECAGDAADNAYIKKEVDDNIKLLRSRVKEKADPQAPKLLEAQELIKRQMWAQRPEIHRELMKLWHETVKDIMSYNWDLSEEIHYAEAHKGGPINFWVGDADDRGLAGKIPVGRHKAVLLIKFLKFVREESLTKNPIEYTKQMLLKQGITKDNFHHYADMLAFPNPWLAT